LPCRAAAFAVVLRRQPFSVFSRHIRHFSHELNGLLADSFHYAMKISISSDYADSHYAGFRRNIFFAVLSSILADDCRADASILLYFRRLMAQAFENGQHITIFITPLMLR
jgi:hypothetical protein